MLFKNFSYIVPLKGQYSLTIEFSKSQTKKNDENTYYRKKRSLQKIERLISLPFSILEKDTSATYKDGILRIVTPKRNLNRRFIDIE
jgi:HSP20 family protein